LRNTEKVSNADYVVIESVYGDRTHEPIEVRKDRLEDIIEDTVHKKGALLIPAFSLERTQEILFEIEQMIKTHKIPLIPVFIDSPLAIQITAIYKQYEEYFNKEVQYIINSGKKIFSFSQLHFTLTSEESKKIKSIPNPKIIIAGSGMSQGGRILFHEKIYLPDPRSTLLFVSYQAPFSLGREIQEGAKSVYIFDEKVPIHARVETIQGYSAHRDSEGLLRFIEETSDTLKKVFVIMGEPKSATFLTQRIRDYLGVNAIAPQEGDSFLLEL